ncbi:Reticulon-domain-containing protein [Mariannaea sp. PMI_226]|nr:Reticulon-domain-containing protein [Mariannaea sp. PMI_226]
MSGPAYVVIPVQADNSQRSKPGSAEIASAIQQSLRKKTHAEDHDRGEPDGPLKQILGDYIQSKWEDPGLSLGSYFGGLIVLFGAHYLPLTQLALKTGAVALGAISAIEFISRHFSSDTFLSRLRPKKYKKVPESTLNATLKYIHDSIQYFVVQVQKIIFGQDLSKTFTAFLSFTALYWLVQLVSTFSLAVLGLTLLYIAPFFTAPRGRHGVCGAIGNDYC